MCLSVCIYMVTSRGLALSRMVLSLPVSACLCLCLPVSACVCVCLPASVCVCVSVSFCLSVWTRGPEKRKTP